MPTLEEDLEHIRAAPAWQEADETRRRDLIRQIAAQSAQEDPPEYHQQLTSALWQEVDPDGALTNAAQWVGNAVKETALSIPAVGVAAGMAASDSVNLSDTGSGTRLSRGVANLWDAAGQRIKQMMPGDKQEELAAALADLQDDIHNNAVPQGFKSFLAGDDPDDEDGRQFVDVVGRGLARLAVQADHSDATPEQEEAFLASDRSLWSPAAREQLADYMVTRDPSSWAAFVERVTETDAQHTTRLERQQAERAIRNDLEDAPEWVQSMAERGMDMQTSPIDIATAALPLLRGMKLLKAVKTGQRGAAGGLTVDSLKEGGQEALTSYLEDARNTGTQIAEAAAMGTVRGAAVQAPFAIAGKLMQSSTAQPVPPAPTIESEQDVPDVAALTLQQVAARGGMVDPETQPPQSVPATVAPLPAQPLPQIQPDGSPEIWLQPGAPSVTAPSMEPGIQPAGVQVDPATGTPTVPGITPQSGPMSGTAAPAAVDVPRQTQQSAVMPPPADSVTANALPGQDAAASRPRVRMSSSGVKPVPYRENIASAVAGRLPANAVLQINNQPGPVLQAAGLPAIPMEMRRRVVGKKTSKHQEMDVATLQALPDAIDKPMAVYVSPRDHKAFAIVTTLDTPQGPVTLYSTVRQRGKTQVLDTKTVFGKDLDQLQGEMQSAHQRGLFRLLNKEAFNGWLAQRTVRTNPGVQQHLPAIEGLQNFFAQYAEESSPPRARLSASAGSTAARGVSLDLADQAVHNLSLVDPAIARNVVIVSDRSSLLESEWHAEDWAEFETADGFFDEQSGKTIVFASNVTQRANETPARAAARVILHERLGHAGFAAWRAADRTAADRWDALVAEVEADPEFSAEVAEITSQRAYAHLADDPASAVEEWAVRQLENLTDAEIAALQPTSTLGRFLQWINDQIDKYWFRHFRRRDATLRELREIMALARQALARAAPRTVPTSRGTVVDKVPVKGALPSFIRPLAPDATSATLDYGQDDPTAAARNPARDPAVAAAILRGLHGRGDQGTSRSQQPAQAASGGGLGLENVRSPQDALPELDVALFAQAREALKEQQGEEHAVYHDKVTNRAVKLTKPRALKGGELAYIERLAKLNAAFGDDLKVEGWITAPGGTRSLVTSQPWVNGRPSTTAEIDDMMRRKGFLKAMDGLWHRERDDLWIGDVENDSQPINGKQRTNVLTDAYGHISIIDATVPTPSDGQAAYFEDLILKQPQPTPKPLPEPPRVKLSSKRNPFHAADAPNWLKSPLNIKGNEPFRVQALGLRAWLKGSTLPDQLIPISRQSVRDITAVRNAAESIGKDLNAAIKAYVEKSGVDELRVHDMVATAMESPAVLQAMPDPDLKEATRRARNFLDDMSQATATIAGGDLGKTILANQGHWMRRSYACFDPASNWTYDNLVEAAAAGKLIAGKPAKKILDDARAYITKTLNAQRAANGQGKVSTGEVEAAMRDLTDRNVWQSMRMEGGERISKDTSSLMHRADYHADVKAWMNTVKLSAWDHTQVGALAKTGGLYEGRSAAQLLASARSFLQARHPQKTEAEITEMLSQQDIPAPIKALMGEETNPLKRFISSASFQAQFLARHEQQVAMRDIGLATGLFSRTKTGQYHAEIGNTRERSGFKVKVRNAKGEIVEQPIYTTPELLAALSSLQVADPISGSQNLLAMAAVWLNREAKLNKIALNPYGWVSNGLLGNFFMLMSNGDLASTQIFRRVYEAINLQASGKITRDKVKGAVKQALLDQRRQMMARLTALGVAEAGLDISVLEDSLQRGLGQFVEQVDHMDRVKGAVRGAVYGLSTGGGMIGAGVGAVAGAVTGNARTVQGLERIADLVMGKPDRIAKITSYLTNYEAGLAAGMTPQQAEAMAAEKTLNTMPNYGALWAPVRSLSRIGLGVGATVSFVHEMFRNSYWNARYMVTEMRSGNPAMQKRGLQRLAGIAAVYATIKVGLPALIQGLFGGSEEEDKKGEAWKRALGMPWEKHAPLVFTKATPEEVTFINQSYLVPQLALAEIINSALNGRDFSEAMTNARESAANQWFGGGIGTNALLRAFANAQPNGMKISYAPDAWTNMQERGLYVIAAAMTPGIVELGKNVAWAVDGHERFGRKYSFDEIFMNLAGVRSKTYTTEQRLRGRLYEIRDMVAGARDWARMEVKKGNDPQAALATATRWQTEAQAELDDLLSNMQQLGTKDANVKAALKRTSVRAKIKPLGLSDIAPK